MLQENAIYFIVIYLSWSQLSLVLTFSRTPDYGGNINWAIISFSREIPRRFIMKDFLKQSAKLTQHTTYNLHFRTKLSLALWVLCTTLAKVEMSEILRCRWASRNMLGGTVTGHWWAAKVRLECSEVAYRGTGPFMINTIHYKYWQNWGETLETWHNHIILNMGHGRYGHIMQYWAVPLFYLMRSLTVLLIMLMHSIIWDSVMTSGGANLTMI